MKRLFLVPFLPLILCSIAGCSNANSQTKISYGSYIDLEAKQISYEEVKTRCENKENMVVATFYKTINSCECQTIFFDLLKDFMKESNYLIYSFNTEEMDEAKDKLGFINQGFSAPSLYLINKGKVTAKYLYTQKAYEKVFKDKDKLSETIYKAFKKPSLYFVDDAYISNNINNIDKVGLAFLRRACPDCSYFLPNFLLPYQDKNDLKVNTWLFELDEYFGTDNYQPMKDKYHLSYDADKTFGYDKGKVPTIHYYEKGQLKSACVYFNDTLTFDFNKDKYVISETYYTEERISNLDYLDSSDVLLNKEIEKTEVASNFWINSYASVVHNKIIEKFYNYYFK